MTDLTIAELDAIIETAKLATPGPWPVPVDNQAPGTGIPDCIVVGIGNDQDKRDAAHIANCDPDTIRKMAEMAKASLGPAAAPTLSGTQSKSGDPIADLREANIELAKQLDILQVVRGMAIGRLDVAEEANAELIVAMRAAHEAVMDSPDKAEIILRIAIARAGVK
jgi:hypothetical protein